jgi:hypothetical protein
MQTAPSLECHNDVRGSLELSRDIRFAAPLDTPPLDCRDGLDALPALSMPPVENDVDSVIVREADLEVREELGVAT